MVRGARSRRQTPLQANGSPLAAVEGRRGSNASAEASPVRKYPVSPV
jgi:hypothetical protein